MPRVPTIWNRIARVFSKADEGAPRAGPWQLPVSGGWLTPDYPGYGNNWNWWQLGGNITGGGVGGSAMVEACVSAYAQTVAMLPGTHWRRLDNGGRERVKNSALSRILKHPNTYQSNSDFMLNAVRSLYLNGNCYALALRNLRYEIDELHLMDPDQCSAWIAETGDIFYRLGGNSVIDYMRRIDDRLDPNVPLIVPQRDVLHIRINAYDRRKWPYPLIGESPLVAAYGDISLYDKIKNQQEQFFGNQARPSAVLSTDLVLDKDQVQQLRDRWNDQAKGLHAGGVPILTAGLKVQPWSEAKARDMQVAEQLKLTQDQIALVFRIPAAVLGLVKAPVSSVEALMNSWITTGLGFCTNHIEEAYGVLFALEGQPDEYMELDMNALLRSAQKERIDMLARAVQGGLYSVNEARAMEDMPEVKYGEEPRLQAQVVPLSAAGAQPEAAPSAPAASGATIGGPQMTTPGAPVGPTQEQLPPGTKHYTQKQHERLLLTSSYEWDRRRRIA